jgi:hypothetical protein
VLAGVELLADGADDVAGAGDVVVVDVGGATTDVYSVLTPDPEEASLHREVVEVLNAPSKATSGCGGTPPGW